MKKEKKEYLKGIFRAEHKNARVSPKKARDVARAIQGMRVDEAVNALTFTPRKSARLIKNIAFHCKRPGNLNLCLHCTSL